MKVIQYKTYGFRIQVEDVKRIIVCAPSMVEACQIFSVMHKDEPFDVVCLGDVYLLDSE